MGRKYKTRFPMARIKKMMQTDDEVGKVASATPLCISRACELFMEFLVLKSCDRTRLHHAKTLSADHVKECIVTEPKFDFLREKAGDLRPEQVASAPPKAPTPKRASQSAPSSRSQAHAAEHKNASAAGGAPKRGRGRPRKGEEVNPPRQKTSGVGERPKAKDSDAAAGGPEKRKRGRPRKTDGGEGAAGASPPVAKGRGRPKKNAGAVGGDGDEAPVHVPALQPPAPGIWQPWTSGPPPPGGLLPPPSVLGAVRRDAPEEDFD